MTEYLKFEICDYTLYAIELNNILKHSKQDCFT